MRIFVLQKLFLLFSIIWLSSAIPTLDSSAPTQHIFSTDHHAPSPSPSFLSRVCSSLIERIWPYYKKSPSWQEKLSQNASPKKVQTKYGDDLVLRFKIRDLAEARVFAEAVETLYLDIWEATKDWADIRISRKVLPSFLSLLPPSMQQSHSPVITDLSQAVYNTYPTLKHEDNARQRPTSGMPHDLFFENYQPLSVLYPWLRQHASIIPERMRLFTIGTSYEGRDIPAVQLGFESTVDEAHQEGPRHTIVIIAGGHAREWITTSTAAFLIRSLVHNADPQHQELVSKLLTHYDFVIVPVLNPDGYEYTFTTDRLWRKNRQQTSLPFCRGIDLDRAFPFGWDGDTQVDNPCLESYAGEHPLQAVEAKVLVEWAKNQTQEGSRVFDAFIDLHAYSQEILYPYSYSCDRVPTNLEDLEELAIGLAKSFRLSNGHYYTVDSACEGSVTLRTPISSKNKELVSIRVEESGGSALDFFYQEMRVKYAFQVKLRDTGSYGFLLPKENIVPTGEETFGALMSLGRWLLGNRGIETFGDMTSDEIWGEETVIIGQSHDSEDTVQSNDNEVDDNTWWRRRRR